MKNVGEQTTIKMYVVGGPLQGVTAFNKAELINVIQGIFKTGTYALAYNWLNTHFEIWKVAWLCPHVMIFYYYPKTFITILKDLIKVTINYTVKLAS